MSWNYRVVRTVYEVPKVSGGYTEVTFAIHEVYYDKDQKPYAVTKNAAGPHGETKEELREDFKRMEAAFSRLTLEMKDFEPGGAYYGGAGQLRVDHRSAAEGDDAQGRADQPESGGRAAVGGAERSGTAGVSEGN